MEVTKTLGVLRRLCLLKDRFFLLLTPGACSLRMFGLSVVCMNKDGLGLMQLICTCPSIRQPVNPRTRQQPQLEASPQEPEEPEEILGSDDEEQEDPHDYCKGESHVFWYSVIQFLHNPSQSLD